MFSSVHSMSLHGINVREVSVEADVSEGGLPVFEMVGFLGSEIKESRGRIRTALKNSGFFLLKKFSETQERSVSCIDSGNGYLVKRQPRTLCEIM